MNPRKELRICIFILVPFWCTGNIPPLQLLAGSGIKRSVDGSGSNASFDTPLSLATSRNSLFAIVTERTRIRKVWITSGNVVTLAGSDVQGSNDGIGSRASFFRPVGVAISSNEIAYIADWNLNASKHKIRALDVGTNIVSTLSLNGQISLKGPSAIALSDDDSVLFIADTWWVLKIDIANGTLSWLTGSGYSISYQDGIGRAAFFVNIGALAVGPSSNYILVTDSNFPGTSQEQESNSLRLINVSSGEVLTVCGGVARGFSDAVGTSALFDQPQGVALAQNGSLALILDYGNQRIRIFDLSTRTVSSLVETGQRLPAISSQRTKAGNSIAFTPDGLSMLVINITGNSLLIIRCPSGDCAPNFYRTPCGITSIAGGDGKCIRCPNNTVSKMGSTSITDCACDLGQYGPLLACALCPEGKYKDYFTAVSQGELDCLPCNKTGYSSLPGSRSQMNCSQCSGGYYRNKGVCRPCPANTSKFVIGDSNCSVCPPGALSSSGALFCTCGASMVLENNSCVCNSGYFGRKGGPCLACPAGKYKNFTGSPGNCSQCPSNTYSLPGQSQCICNAGFFLDTHQGGNVTCASCPNGTYKNVSGDRLCAQCDLPRMCGEPSIAIPNSSNTTLDSSTFYESFAPFFPHAKASSPFQGGLFWLSCTQQMNGQCLRCPSAQLDAIPGLNGISACSCRPGFFAVRVYESLKYLYSLSVSPSTNESFFLQELNNTQNMLNGKEICRSCPNGTYKNYIGPGPCSVCPPHSTSSNGSFDVNLCACNAGYYKEFHGLQNFTCEQCTVGKYKPGAGDFNCSSCPVGKYTLYPGSSTSEHCICAPGFYPKQSFCNKCDRGKFKNTTGSIPCSFCPQGFYQDQLGSSVCKICAVGTYNGRIGQKQECSCNLCPPNSTTLASGSIDISECTCKAGFFGESTTGNGSCTMCAPGTAKNFTGFDDKCDMCLASDPESTTEPTMDNPPTSCLCGVGWTGPDYGPCTECTAGTYKSMLGSSQCQQCQQNYYSSYPTLSHCISCPQFAVLLDPQGDKEDCACNAGFTGDTAGCSQCEPGLYKTGIGFQDCIACEPGTYSDLSSTYCRACPFQSTSPIGSSSEQNCSCGPGFTQNLDIPSSQLVCMACPAGKYKNISGSANCTANPPNSMSNDGSAIFACNSGFYVNKDRDGCAECISFYSPGGLQNLTVCSGSEYFDTQQCSCASCPVHQIVVARSEFVWNESLDIKIPGELRGAQSIQDCVCQGGYTCASCPYCPSCPDPCVPCDGGTYKDYAGGFPCTTCPMEVNGTVQLTSARGSVGVSQCTCPPGYIIMEDLLPEIHCSPCEPGTYSKTIGSSSCELCPIQKTSAAGSSGCVDCRQGDVCVCDVGNTLNLGEGLLCIPCSPGTYKALTGPQPCTPCQQFLRFQSLPGMTSCTSCTPTKRCPLGMYWQTCGSDFDGSCLPCRNPIPQNAEYSGPGFPLNSSICPWRCKDGYELAFKGVCRACPKGTFKGSLQPNCTKCPKYSTNLVSGQKSCTRCVDGYYLSGFSDEGHGICLRCSAFHSTVRSTGLRAGSYFSDACKCESGFFGCSWNCTECPPGSFKDYVSIVSDDNSECIHDACIICPDGTYSLQSGQSSSSACRTCDNTTLGSWYNRTGCECPPSFGFVSEYGKCTNSSISS